jgi:predicted NBD/HSP70 family sugar kinase
VNPEAGYVVGVDVGETAVMVELFDLRMRALASHRSVTRHPRLEPAEVVDLVVCGIESVVEESGVEPADILGVGVGVPGLVERMPVDAPHSAAESFGPGDGTEAVVYEQSMGWGVHPIERRLRERIELPIIVDNGANTLGQAERWFGAAKDCDDAIIVLLGAGVGASILPADTAANAFAGELGHTTIAYGGRECVCGARGCLEAYAGAEAVVARYDELVRRDDGHAHPAGEQCAGLEERMLAILRAHDRDDPAAAQAVEELVQYLGVGLANLVNLFTPERIVIGGWLGHALPDTVLSRITDAVGRNALARGFERLEVVRARLGADAVALGAATLPVAAFLDAGGELQVGSRRSTVAASL